MISSPLPYLPRLVVNPDHFSSNIKLQPEGSCKGCCIGKQEVTWQYDAACMSNLVWYWGGMGLGKSLMVVSLLYLPIQPMYMYMYHILHVLIDTPNYSIFVPTIISLIPRPSGEDSLVFKVRILGIFAYVNHVILVGWVGGASQTNGISWLTWRHFPAVPLLSVLLKVVSQLLTFWKILEE